MKKIILVTEIYDSYIMSEQKSNKLETISIDYLLNNTPSWISSMYKSLKLLGLDVHVILTNRSIYLNQCNSTNMSYYQFIQNKLNEINPHYILFTNPKLLTANQILNIKTKFKKIKFICHYCSFIGEKIIETLSNYDLILSCSPAFLVEHENLRKKQILFYHSCPDEGFQIKEKKLEEKKLLCSFFGSLFSDLHSRRKKIIDYLIRKDTAIDIFTSFQGSIYGSRYLTKVTEHFGFNQLTNLIDSFESEIFKKINPCFKGSFNQLFGNDMLEAMSNYICTLNVHASFANNFSANMRIFEATSLGTCLITEHTKNIKDLFEPDYEVLTYKSNDECYEKIKFCLLNPEKAYQIGINARKRAIDFHRYSNRLEFMLDNLI